MDAAVAGLIGAFGGASLGILGALKINADQRRQAQQSERQRAFSAYLGALYPVITELREMPQNSEPDALTRVIDRLQSEQVAWVRTRKGMVSTFPHAFGPMDRLSAAMAVVQTLEMPTAVLEVVERANDYAAELGEERTDALRERWPELQEQLLGAAKLL